MRLCIALVLGFSHSCSRCHIALIRDAGKPQGAWDPSEWILRPIQPRVGAKSKQLRCSPAARWRSAAYQVEWRQLRHRSERRITDNGPLRGNPGAALICVTVHDDNEAKVQQTAASAVNQRAAARLHVESLGFTVEKHTGEATGRSVAGHTNQLLEIMHRPFNHISSTIRAWGRSSF